jgi:hypothetical protein
MRIAYTTIAMGRPESELYRIEQRPTPRGT